MKCRAGRYYRFKPYRDIIPILISRYLLVQLHDTLRMRIDKINTCYLATPHEMADGSSVELLSLEGATSTVWRPFGFLRRNGKIFESNKKKRQFVYCKHCSKRPKYNGSTTTMCSHLENKSLPQVQCTP